MGGPKLKEIKIDEKDENKDGLKTAYIYINKSKLNEERLIKEIRGSNKPIVLDSKGEMEIDYCLAADGDVRECSVFFNPNDMKDIAIQTGSVCKGLNFRPGSIIVEESGWFNRYAYIGNKCKLKKIGLPIYDDDMKRCCLQTNTSECNTNLLNNFTTDHCNQFMSEYCATDPENEKCLIWLDNVTKRDNDIALRTYADICKKNFDSFSCTVFCSSARKSNYSNYCDIALDTWCNNNSVRTECDCYLRTEKINDFSEFLGPKECWLSSCSNKLVDSKWLSSDQLITKINCKVLSCIITIDKLSLKGQAKANLINTCISGSTAPNNQTFSKLLNIKEIEPDQMSGSGFSFYFLFIFLVIALLSFSYKKNIL